MLRPNVPLDLARYVQAAQTALRQGDLQRACDVAQQAIAIGIEEPQLLTLSAYRNLEQNDYESALRLAARACELAPRNIDALNAAGTALHQLGRSDEAVPYLEKALALAPDDVDLLVTTSGVFEQLRQTQRACSLLERAFERDPRRADAAARLAFISANRGEMDKARKFGAMALSLDRTQAFASFAIAAADIDEGKYQDAHDRLRAVMAIPKIGRIIEAIGERMLGDALDGLGRYSEAFAAYSKGGEELRVLYAPPAGTEVETALDRSRRIAAYVSGAPAESWMSKKGNSSVRSHVFLLGFPRSGTTLLTHVLNAHPDVTALDEPQTLTESGELVASDAGLEKLAALADPELAPYREAYWRRAAAAGFAGDTGVLVEKMPLYSEILCLIAKLFPDAKILVALRDPRDVVLSCFRRRFAFTRQMYELLTLEGATNYYDATMRLLELYRTKIALPFREIRHEDLVLDFEGQTRALCGFMGVDPNVALTGYAERVRHSDMATPNAAQISRGIRRESMAQWRPYAEQMKPVMPLLEPWIARFGYEGTADATSS
ncbi:MAG: sulfotransferase [Alphaproteobacteria bacterium]|nr:sulfotransferase [Alphaproteobacteria bacterium]